MLDDSVVVYHHMSRHGRNKVIYFTVVYVCTYIYREHEKKAKRKHNVS